MTNYGCWWWWLLLGGLLGWLASWWLGRNGKQTVTVERVVEKIIDRPVERIVEKVVDRPLQVIVEKLVEKIVDRPVDRPVDRIVDRVVEKPVDNPLHLNRIQVLEAEAAQIPALQAAVTRLKADAARQALLSVPPSVPNPVPPGSSYSTASASLKPLDPPPQPVPEKLTNRIMDRALDRLLDRQAAVAAGFSVRGMDDLEIIEGIGPKIAALFKADGIRMFWELAQTPQLRMQAILDRAGPNFRIANPSTWARQADLAANNRWDALRKLQDELSAGVDKSGKGEL